MLQIYEYQLSDDDDDAKNINIIFKDVPKIVLMRSFLRISKQTQHSNCYINEKSMHLQENN